MEDIRAICFCKWPFLLTYMSVTATLLTVNATLLTVTATLVYYSILPP